MKKVSPEQIDALLPQTQCGLCSYKGCMPYAEAIVFENAPINLCPPGGIETLYALGELLEQDPSPYHLEMQQKSKPPSLALIREAECIGCTKCIDACPVDAIIGGAKQMHSVLTDLCTGCELCIPPCPVDCIEMLTSSTSASITDEKKSSSRKRFLAREQRLTLAKKQKNALRAKETRSAKQDYIAAAIARAVSKRK